LEPVKSGELADLHVLIFCNSIGNNSGTTFIIHLLCISSFIFFQPASRRQVGLTLWAEVCHEKQDSEILFRNCINDGRRTAVHALQQECTNRLKVLCLKGKVLNVQVKRHRKVSGTCNGVECK